MIPKCSSRYLELFFLRMGPTEPTPSSFFTVGSTS